MLPIIGITADHQKDKHILSEAYAKSVIAAGGTPMILPPIVGMESTFLAICDGLVFSGGDDPIMEHWGIPTHAKAKPVSADRQQFELALLQALQEKSEIPVLGICLGMQWMGLLAGGILEQDLSEPSASLHASRSHEVCGQLGKGVVHSHHHQGLLDAGSLTVVAQAEDGMIEAVQDHAKAWFVGVQWHPERTKNDTLGQGLFDRLIIAAKVKSTVNL